MTDYSINKPGNLETVKKRIANYEMNGKNLTVGTNG